MSSFQQKLALKGSEESIEYFAGVLKDVKDRGGWNTAAALCGSLEYWDEQGSPSAVCSAQNRQGKVRPLGLLVLGTAEVHKQLTGLLEKLRSDHMMSLVMMRNKVGKEAWLLEALVVSMELYLESAQSGAGVTVMANGLRCSAGGSQVLPSLSLPSVELGSLPPPSSRLGWRQALYQDQAAPSSSPSSRTSWRTSFAAPPEEEEDRERRRLAEMEERKVQRRPSLLAVRRKSSVKDKDLVRRTRRNTLNSDSDMSFSELSIGGTRRKKEKRKKPLNKSCSPPLAKKVAKGLRYNIARIDAPIRPSKDRREGASQLGDYILTECPDDREVPGFEGVVAKWDRNKHGVDCDEVFPGIILGNGATVKKKDYLKKIGTTHVLNAAEFRGVNVGEDFFSGTGIQYKGLRIEDTPQTQICRHFMDVADFIDSALSDNGRVFVNCVFGRSRSTTCVVVYLMLKHDWSALRALKHIREKRPVQINDGFMQQLSDLDYKIAWAKQLAKEQDVKSCQ